MRRHLKEMLRVVLGWLTEDMEGPTLPEHHRLVELHDKIAEALSFLEEHPADAHRDRCAPRGAIRSVRRPSGDWLLASRGRKP